MNNNYISFARNLIDWTILKHDLQLIEHDISAMGEWYVWFENPEFIVGVSKDRIEFTSIEIGSKKRRKPRAHARGPWSMSHLRGYLEEKQVHYRFLNIEEEALWFKNNDSTIFDSNLLNSDELNKWAVKASRKLFS
jgi:hypothetical protein